MCGFFFLSTKSLFPVTFMLNVTILVSSSLRTETGLSVNFTNWLAGVLQCLGLSMMQDRDLSEYNPALSSTSKYLSCSHQLCAWSTTCKSPDEPCTYKRDYYSDNTSTSGFMIEDKLYLASFSKHGTQSLLQASVVLGWALTASHILMFSSSLMMLNLRYWNDS